MVRKASGQEDPTSGDARGLRAHEAAVSVALLRQWNFENLPVAIDHDDCGICRFATQRQFKSDPLCMLQCQGGICKHFADLILDE